uniref:Protein UL29 n=1 Tax=Hipposideros bat herpesvirus TaxID=3141919 RepID=A0AAU7E066_9VIRU
MLERESDFVFYGVGGPDYVSYICPTARRPRGRRGGRGSRGGRASGRRGGPRCGMRRKPCTVEELSECCRRGDSGYLSGYVKNHLGACLIVKWPKDSSLILSDMDAFADFTDEDLKRCQTDYLGHYEIMTLVGYVDFSIFRYPIMVTENEHVYSYDRRGDCLYMLAFSFEEFAEIGLCRLDPVRNVMGNMMKDRVRIDTDSKHSDKIRYAASLEDFKDFMSIKDQSYRMLYAKLNKGKHLRLAWPDDHYMMLTDAQSAGVTCWELRYLQDRVTPREPICLMGIITSEGENPLFKNLGILISDSGSVYAHVMGSRHVVKISDSVRTFARVGLSWMVDRYRYECIGGIVPKVDSMEKSADNTLPFKKRR